MSKHPKKAGIPPNEFPFAYESDEWNRAYVQFYRSYLDSDAALERERVIRDARLRNVDPGLFHLLTRLSAFGGMLDKLEQESSLRETLTRILEASEKDGLIDPDTSAFTKPYFLEPQSFFTEASIELSKLVATAIKSGDKAFFSTLSSTAGFILKPKAAVDEASRDQANKLDILHAYERLVRRWYGTDSTTPMMVTYEALRENTLGHWPSSDSSGAPRTEAEDFDKYKNAVEGKGGFRDNLRQLGFGDLPRRRRGRKRGNG